MNVENLSSYTLFFVSAQFTFALEFLSRKKPMRGDAEAVGDSISVFMKELTSRNVGTWVLLWSLPLNMCVTMFK